MIVQTYASTRFGTLEIPLEGELFFPHGLIGIEGSRFALVVRDPESRFAWLHSLDDPDFAIPVCDPWLFFQDYEVELSAQDADRVGVEDPTRLDVFVTVRALGEPEDFAANLRAPIVIHDRIGHQVINVAEHAPVRAALFPAGAPAAAVSA